MQVVEMEHEDGYRFWSRPLEDHEVTEYIQHFTMLGYSVSDIDEPAQELPRLAELMNQPDPWVD